LVVDLVTEAGWHRSSEVGGVPLWQWQEDQMVRVATYDHDVLRIIGAALNYHDTASPADSHAFITAHLLGGRSGTPSDGPLGLIAHQTTADQHGR
jgi:hypothetical protein